MNALKFLTHIQTSDRNEALMARIALNKFVGPNDYPVDISELRLLSEFNRGMTTLFREWAFTQYVGLHKDLIALLKQYAEEAGRITA